MREAQEGSDGSAGLSEHGARCYENPVDLARCWDGPAARGWPLVKGERHGPRARLHGTLNRKGPDADESKHVRAWEGSSVTPREGMMVRGSQSRSKREVKFGDEEQTFSLLTFSLF